MIDRSNVENTDLIIREGLKDLRKKVGMGTFYDEEMHALAHLMEARAAYANSMFYRAFDEGVTE